MSPASLMASPELEAADLPDVVVDPSERDNQLEAAAAGSGGINSDSYQDFVSIVEQHENLSMITDGLIALSCTDQKVLLLQ